MFDFDRSRRTGLEEVVLCEGKSVAQLQEIFHEVTARTPSLMFTRLDAEKHSMLPDDIRARLDYEEVSRTAIFGSPRRSSGTSTVAVVTGGTSDISVAKEAVRTLHYFGILAEEIYDVGVAGLWRLLDRVELLRRFPVIIAAAGMDAALPTVLAGLVPGVVIAVPTSVGYGMADGGRAALAALLTSCAQGIAVVNIDNGFGAACVALRCLGPHEPQ